MSFEKAVKNMGTRRKARECALQMLYAADVTATPGNVLVRYYWSEYGYNELFKDANSLIDSFIEDISYTLTNTSEISRSIGSKKVSGYLREVKSKEKEILLVYKRFVEKLVNGDYPSTFGLIELLKDFKISVKRVITESANEARFSETGLSSSDVLSSPSVEQIDKTLEKLFSATLPQIETLIESTSHSRKFTDNITLGTLREIKTIDDRIRTRAEHWRIERMAIVDRNVLRMAVYEFLFEDTPHTVVINEALEIARRFSTFEATQFINGILDAIKHDLEKDSDKKDDKTGEKSQASSL